MSPQEEFPVTLSEDSVGQVHWSVPPLLAVACEGISLLVGFFVYELDEVSMMEVPTSPSLVEVECVVLNGFGIMPVEMLVLVSVVALPSSNQDVS